MYDETKVDPRRTQALPSYVTTSYPIIYRQQIKQIYDNCNQSFCHKEMEIGEAGSDRSVLFDFLLLEHNYIARYFLREDSKARGKIPLQLVRIFGS